MKILQVTNFFKPSWEAGGVTRVCYEISKNLSLKENDVTVYTTDGFKSRLDVKVNVPICVDGIRVYYFYNLFIYLVKKMNLTTPYYLPFVLRTQIKKYDIIHIHEHRTLSAVLVHYYAKKYKKPYILQSHGTVLKIMRMDKFKSIFDRLFGYDILRDASKIIAVSNIEVNQYKQMGIPEEKIVTIPNGIDINYFKNLPEKGKFRKDFGIVEKHIILYLGRLNERKGIEFLIRSYAELCNELDDVVLILAGSDDGYKHKAELIVEELNIANKIKFVGYLSEAESLAAYVDADILVYPSILEIFGLVPFESIMCDTPVIVTDDCGCGELVKKANCGHLVKYGDILELKNKMKLLVENPKLGMFFTKNGSKYIQDHLSWDQITYDFEAVYSTVITEPI